MNFDQIVNDARRATGLPDPELDFWREGLAILLRDHEKMDVLSPRGRDILRSRYTTALAARIRVDHCLRERPALTASKIERPLFILGMPRTGTTMVSYLLDCDARNRSLLKWEAYDVAPPAAPGATRTDARCVAEKERDTKLIEANPKALATHFEAADGPTECVHLLAQDFKSMMFAVLSTTPTYHDWLLACDVSSAFAHRKRALQILQSTNPGRWVLKMPSDALFIRTLFATFPDAKVIWTHRDPYAAFASSMSMRASSRPLFSKDADAGYMRERFPLQLALHLARPLELSRERPDAIHHLYYDDLMATRRDEACLCLARGLLDHERGSQHEDVARREPAGPLRQTQLFTGPVGPAEERSRALLLGLFARPFGRHGHGDLSFACARAGA